MEVTTQACGIQGYGDTTVKLTRQQYNDLEEYLVEFRARLNQTSTREEAIPLFKDAVVELYRYGFLPKGMKVEKAQKLVIGEYLNKNILKLLEKLIHNHFIASDVNSNSFCLVTGTATRCYVAGPLYKLFNMLDIPTFGFWFSFINFYLRPIYPFGLLCFGQYWHVWGGTYNWKPSTGNIYSSGAQGKKTLDGEFYGRIDAITLPILGQGGIDRYFIGVTGFVGLHITIENGNTQFIGWCRKVDVTSQQPTF